MKGWGSGGREGFKEMGVVRRGVGFGLSSVVERLFLIFFFFFNLFWWEPFQGNGEGGWF